MTSYLSKLCRPDHLAQRAQQLPRPLVLTNGVFDLLHCGHADYLHRARALGASLLVALNDDASARRLRKGAGRPFHPCDQRMRLLAALASTDLVISFSEDDATAIVRCVRPDLYVKGGDYDVAQTPEGQLACANGARVMALPFVHYTSTTALVNRIIQSSAVTRGLLT
jgi:rfaE bifunctional protein nucleotidyltransferase chain/domain